MKQRDTLPIVPTNAELEDLKERRRLLLAASRPNEPLTDKAGTTVQGHVVSAIAKLDRALERAHFG